MVDILNNFYEWLGIHEELPLDPEGKNFTYHINNLSYEQRLYYNIKGIYNKIYYKDKAYKLHYGIFNVREYLYSSNIIRKHYLNLYCKDLQ